MALPCARSRLFIPLTLIVIFISFHGVDCRYTDEAEFTMVVKAYQQECFFQEAKKGQYLEVEFQVLDSNLDALKLDFSVTTAQGVSLVSERGKADSSHRTLVPLDGALKICLDNRPYFSTKTVYVEVFVEDADAEDEHAGDDDPFELGTVTLEPDTGFNSTEIDKIRHRISRIYENLNGAQRYQEWQKAHEARHRNLIEHLYSVLNALAFLQTLQMVLLLFVQVKVIEKFFEGDSFVTKFRKWLTK